MKNILLILITTLLFISISSGQNPYPIVPIDSVQFVNQVKLTATPVVDLPDYISPTFVNSTYRDTVRFDGVVVTSPNIYGLSVLRKAAYIQRQGGGPWSGVLVMCDPTTLPFIGRPTLADFTAETKFYENMKRGYKVRVTGKFAAFQGETQINLLRNNQNFSNAIEQVDSNNYQPVYTVITVDSLMTGNPTAGNWIQKKAQGEKWEGVLVEFRNVRVSSRAPLGATRWNWSLQDTFGNQIDVRDFSAYYRNDNNESIIPSIPNNFTPPPVGTTLDYIRGIVGEYQIGGVSRFGISPITPDDISTCDTSCYGLSINTNRCAFMNQPMVFNISQYGNFLADTGIFEFSTDSFFNNIIKYDSFSTFNSFSHSYSNNINLNSGNYFVRLRVKNQNLLSNVMEFYMNSNKIFVTDTIITFNKDSLLLDAGSGFTSYLWSTVDTTQTIWAKSTSMYKVTVQNAAGCSATDSTQVIFVKGIQQRDTTICLGYSIDLAVNEKLNIPQNNLISWYPFEGNASDRSGNGNNGIVYGATPTTDRFGRANSAFAFDGLDDYISGTINNFSNTSNTTFSIWLKYTGDAGGMQYDQFFQYGAYGQHTLAYGYNFNGSNLDLYTYCFSNPYTQVNLKYTWKHLVIVDSLTVTKIYLNGNLISTTTSGDNFNCYQNSNAFYIGGGNDNQYVTGEIDDVAIWNRALTPQEIQQTYNSGYNQYNNIRWSTNDTTNSITVSPNTSTTYYCDITVGSYTFRDSVRINVSDLPNKNVSYTKLGLCKNDTITLSANAGYNYNWFKNDSVVSSLQTLNVAEQGAYRVALTDSFGCKNTSDTLHVFNAPLPSVQFTINDSAQCVNDNLFLFKDSTLIDSGSYNRLWNFGSGNTSTQMEPSFNFSTVGTYPIKLEVSSNYGCKDSLTKTVTVLANPTAGPMLGETNALSVATPYIYTVAQQPNHTYNWVVSNGIIAAGQGTNAATVQWLSNGKGSLKVEVTNVQGCNDTTATQVTIGNVGLNDLNNLKELVVYPNPSNGTFAVSFSAIKSSTVEMSLVNLLGQQIWNAQHAIQAGEQSIQINANLSPGVYTLRINGAEEQVQYKVIIK